MLKVSALPTVPLIDAAFTLGGTGAVDLNRDPSLRTQIRNAILAVTVTE